MIIANEVFKKKRKFIEVTTQDNQKIINKNANKFRVTGNGDLILVKISGNSRHGEDIEVFHNSEWIHARIISI